MYTCMHWLQRIHLVLGVALLLFSPLALLPAKGEFFHWSWLRRLRLPICIGSAVRPQLERSLSSSREVHEVAGLTHKGIALRQACPVEDGKSPGQESLRPLVVPGLNAGDAEVQQMLPQAAVIASYMHLGDANGFLVQGQGLVESTYRA